MPAGFIFATLTALNRPFSHDAGRDGFRRVDACAPRAFTRGVRRVNALSQKGGIYSPEPTGERSPQGEPSRPGGAE